MTNPFSVQKINNHIFYGWIVLITSFILSAVGMGVYYCFGVFLKPLQDEFNVGRAAVSSIYSVYGLVQLAAVLGGKASDKWGPRIVLGISGPICCLAFILSSHVSYLWQLYITYSFLLGIGGCAAYTTSLATISRWFVKKRGLAMGLISAGIACGMMIMPPIVQNFIDNYGWRTAMVILGIASLIVYEVCALTIWKKPEDVGLLPYGIEKNTSNVTSKNIAVHSDSPEEEITLKQAIHTRELWLLFALFCTLSMSIMMVNTHIVSYALDSNISAANAALIVSVIGAGGMVGKILGGALSESLGPRRTIMIASVGMAALMIWLTSPLSTLSFFVFAFPFGMGYGGWILSISLLTGEIFGTSHYGEIFAFANMGFALFGSFASPLLAGYLFDSTGSYRIPFLVGAAVSFMGLVCVFLLKKRKLKLNTEH